jgi:bisphosphoglycerate-dependent phosphoglycerate mutase
LSLTWLAKKKMQGEVEFRRHYTAKHGETTAKLRRNYGETTAKTTAKLRRNYGETTAKLRRNYGETTAKLRRNYGETTAELFRAPNPCKHYSSLKVRLMPKKVRLMPKTSGNVIYLRGVLCIERATSMQQRGGKGVGGVPGSASIFSSRALRS